MLTFAARHGKWCLVAGLIAGLALPTLAEALRPYLPQMIAGLLFLAAFRIGPNAVLDGLRSRFGVVGLVLIYQIAFPLLAMAAFHVTGLLGTTAAMAAILMFSAPSVTGSANFALIMKVPPEGALRLLMVGTALFPFTVIPVLLLLPALDASTVFQAALRLILLVLAAGGVAFLLRRRFAPMLREPQQERIDGASAILLGVVVVGLMSAVGPLLINDPTRFAMWLAFACGLNFTAQIVTWIALKERVPSQDRASSSIVAGNRNIALFLVALSPSVTDDLLSFIGCYQIPMYLTPILFRRFYSEKPIDRA